MCGGALGITSSHHLREAEMRVPQYLLRELPIPRGFLFSAERRISNDHSEPLDPVQLCVIA